MTNTATAKPENPFLARGDYSPESVQLMRAMSRYRRETGSQFSTPAQVLAVVKSIGFELPSEMSDDDQVRLFALAMERYKAMEKISHPTCDDVLKVVRRLGFVQAEPEAAFSVEGLPIDRRRREEDSREDKSERRASLEPSPQEMLDLTEEEHEFLDQLKHLREVTGRQFASSEELLSILWDLGYRPVNEEGYLEEWLAEDARCAAQAAFTGAVEARLASQSDGQFLTCRGIFEIIDHIGFRRD
ncbi:MAG: hypothetical protein NXI04_25080 [Planctomycetaceae bacterium]|nr:hypothetical protein [Planctomycetaceae bacterium]